MEPLQLYELRRHGNKDTEYFDIEDILFALYDAGYPVDRHFYEDGDFEDEAVNAILEKEGLAALPITVMDGKIAIKARYPSLNELANYFDVEITFQPEEDCCGEDGCCCHHDHNDEHHCCHHGEGEEHHCCHHEENDEHHCCHEEDEQHHCCGNHHHHES